MQEPWVEEQRGRSKMVLHKGAKLVSLESVVSTPLPEADGRYGVVPHGAVIDLVQTRVAREFDVTQNEIEWSYATSHEGQRLFAMASLRRVDDGNWGPAIALRNSYDKSTRFGFGVGARVFICDNLALSGDFVSYSRVHTGNAMEEIELQLVSAIARAQKQYEQVDADMKVLLERDWSLTTGYRALGQAFGQKVLTSRQLGEAMHSWREKDSDYGDRTAYRLYNEITEVLKGTPINQRMGRQVEAHRFLLNETF